MTVLARKRSQAPTEFEMNCARLVKYTVQRANSVPKRYQKFIRPRLLKLATTAYYDVIMGNEADSRTERGRREREKLLDAAAQCLLKLQKPLVVYWSLFDTREGGIREWTELINRELALLNGAAGHTAGERTVPMIEVYDMRYSEDRMSVNAVRELHKYTYSKICSVPLEYKDHLSDQLLCFVDEALFCTLKGNRSIPTNRKQYEIRDRYLRRAIDSLNGMQRPLYALWNVMEYSENTMDDWAERLNEALRLLQGVRKSDRRRFGDLR